MSIDSVDVLHNAEDRIGVLETTLERVLAFLTTAYVVGQPALVAGLIAEVGGVLSAGYERPHEEGETECGGCGEWDEFSGLADEHWCGRVLGEDYEWICDGCGKSGNEDDGCEVDGDCPDEECDGKIRQHKRQETT